MRVLVTGPLNPHGRAIVEALVHAGHDVRAFGVPPGDDPFPDLDVMCHAGWIEVGGSIEPVLAEREVLVHAAGLDQIKDKVKRAVQIERGALYARYGAEREQVDHFIHVTPGAPDRRFGPFFDAATATVEGTQGDINVKVITATDPDSTAKQVVDSVASLPALGSIVGGHTNAVTK